MCKITFGKSLFEGTVTDTVERLAEPQLFNLIESGEIEVELVWMDDDIEAPHPPAPSHVIRAATDIERALMESIRWPEESA